MSAEKETNSAGSETGKKLDLESVLRGERKFSLVENSSVVELTKVLRNGLPYEVLDKFQQASGLSFDEICAVMQMNPKTLQRRKAAGKVTGDESERLYRLFTLFAHAEGFFDGDLLAVRNWLTTPKRALAGETPLEIAKSEAGARKVDDLLGRLEHGVFC